ncbi:MAG: hypothetical protein E6677_04625, partial [Finegoldia magna]|nr:hypothetical protein [Finegoldia magna]
MKINKKLLMAALAGAIVVGGGVNTYAAESAPAPAPEKKSQPAEKILTLDKAKEKAAKDAAAKKAEEEKKKAEAELAEAKEKAINSLKARGKLNTEEPEYLSEDEVNAAVKKVEAAKTVDGVKNILAHPAKAYSDEVEAKKAKEEAAKKAEEEKKKA